VIAVSIGPKAVSKGTSDLFARFAERKNRYAKSKNSNSPFLQPNQFKFYPPSPDSDLAG
jgi:hypothetical protein